MKKRMCFAVIVDGKFCTSYVYEDAMPPTSKDAIMRSLRYQAKVDGGEIEYIDSKEADKKLDRHIKRTNKEKKNGRR